MTDTRALMASIRAGEDVRLELKEVRFRGRRLALGGEDGRAVIRLAEVFVSMANTDGGTVVMGVRDRDRMPVGVDPEKRELLEQFVTGRGARGLRTADRAGARLGVPAGRRGRAETVPDRRDPEVPSQRPFHLGWPLFPPDRQPPRPHSRRAAGPAHDRAWGPGADRGATGDDRRARRSGSEPSRPVFPGSFRRLAESRGGDGGMGAAADGAQAGGGRRGRPPPDPPGGPVVRRNPGPLRPRRLRGSRRLPAFRPGRETPPTAGGSPGRSRSRSSRCSPTFRRRP